jgi:hypothetical protein
VHLFVVVVVVIVDIAVVVVDIVAMELLSMVAKATSYRID